MDTIITTATIGNIDIPLRELTASTGNKVIGTSLPRKDDDSRYLTGVPLGGDTLGLADLPDTIAIAGEVVELKRGVTGSGNPKVYDASTRVEVAGKSRRANITISKTGVDDDGVPRFFVSVMLHEVKAPKPRRTDEDILAAL